MIVVNIIGGLGNQMFQYAFAYAVSKTNNATVKLDVGIFQYCSLREYGLGLFNTNIPLIFEEAIKKKTLFQKLRRKIFLLYQHSLHRYYKESRFHFDEKALHIGDDVYFKGYWQSEKYFKAYRNDLLKQFTLKKELSPEIQTKNYRNRINQFAYQTWRLCYHRQNE